jgi:hypothetical protein
VLFYESENREVLAAKQHLHIAWRANFPRGPATPFFQLSCHCSKLTPPGVEPKQQLCGRKKKKARPKKETLYLFIPNSPPIRGTGPAYTSTPTQPVIFGNSVKNISATCSDSSRDLKTTI